MRMPGHVGPKYTAYDFYKNGLDNTLSGYEVNEIIEEIIGIMKEHKVTVETSQMILEDTISSIKRTTVIK